MTHPTVTESFLPSVGLDVGDPAIHYCVLHGERRVVGGVDWLMHVGPGGGEGGGPVCAAGPPEHVARARGSRTAPYLARFRDGPA